MIIARIKFFFRGIISLFFVSARRDFSGDFSSWKEAISKATGYESNLVIEKTRESLWKVKNGEAVYERDSVLFNEIQYSWPLLAGLLWVASQSGNRINLVDFGGSLGSSYFQNRKMLSSLNGLKWNVVEQAGFVSLGCEYFRDSELDFYYSIQECMTENSIDLIILSSVLPYIENPHALLDEIISYSVPFIIIDRTPVIELDRDLLTVQKVPPSIYSASYPAWFFNRESLMNKLLSEYELVAEFDALTGEIPVNGHIARDKGFILKLKQSEPAR